MSRWGLVFFYLLPGLDYICTLECRVLHELYYRTCLCAVVCSMQGVVSDFVGDSGE